MLKIRLAINNNFFVDVLLPHTKFDTKFVFDKKQKR